MADYRVFCTRFMLDGSECECGGERRCLFRHVPPDRVELDEPLPNGAAFVRGRMKDGARKKTRSSRHPCFYYVRGEHCPYGADCIFSHSRRYLLGRDDVANNENEPSTSAQGRGDLGQNADDDDSTLGATALIRPYPTPGLRGRPAMEAQNDLEQLNIDAPEFYPKPNLNTTANSKKRLCPIAEREGYCTALQGQCTYLHGDVCDLCHRPALHPYNEELRKKHTQECIKRHERNMEISFAAQRSTEKVCGICFEVVVQKSYEERRFGILPNCNHCFCLSCIRKWRQSKQFDNKIIRACPECRISSDFVCPSPYWVDSKNDKDKVIQKYKSALAKKDCKYFKFGRGHCPFGNKCFYKHCLQNGKKIDVGPPSSSNCRHNETPFLDIPGVEIIQRLLMLEHLQEGCPFDELPDDMDLQDILHLFDLSDVLLSDTDESYFSD